MAPLGPAPAAAGRLVLVFGPLIAQRALRAWFSFCGTFFKRWSTNLGTPDGVKLVDHPVSGRAPSGVTIIDAPPLDRIFPAFALPLTPQQVAFLDGEGQS